LCGRLPGISADDSRFFLVHIIEMALILSTDDDADDE
jgi:hypothetical protein